MMTKEIFFGHVRTELENIKQFATVEEIAKLDFIKFDPGKIPGCIYGLMTSSCNSSRAAQLMSKCCVSFVKCTIWPPNSRLYFDVIQSSVISSDMSEFATFKHILQSRRINLYFFSAVEAYVLLDNANNENVFSFLRSETNDLIL